MSKKSFYAVLAIWGLLLFALTTATHAQPPAPQAAGLRVQAGLDRAEPEVLDQGPLHEAFAKPLALEQQKDLIDREPPAPVNELPPEERPEGTNVHWLPGYWSFDQERNDFVWVSGLWRDFPPGRTWVPGEWQQTNAGFQWAPGFWANAEQPEQRLLPVPPDNLDQGPSSPAPGNNFLWNPGCWQWNGADFGWQPGFWYAGQPDWVWVPNHYCYYPSGSVYVSGYWDYPVARRGLCYAPVYWGANYGFGAGYVYRPTAFVNTSLLLANLYLDHHHGCYYYGSRGRQGRNWPPPWNQNAYSQWGRHNGNSNIYDPLWAHYRWNGHRPGAHGKYTAQDLARRNPKSTWNQGDDLVRKMNRLSATDRQALKLHTNNKTELAKYRKNAEKYRNFARTDQINRVGSQNGKKYATLKVPQIQQGDKVPNTKVLNNKAGAKGQVVIDRNRQKLQGQARAQFDKQAKGRVDQRIIQRDETSAEELRNRFNGRRVPQSENASDQLRQRYRSPSGQNPFQNNGVIRQQRNIPNTGQILNSTSPQATGRRTFDPRQSWNPSYRFGGNPPATIGKSRTNVPGQYYRRSAKPVTSNQNRGQFNSSRALPGVQFNQGQLNNRMKNRVQQAVPQKSYSSQTKRSSSFSSGGKGKTRGK